jgi:phosphoribosylamine--glycine ligase
LDVLISCIKNNLSKKKIIWKRKKSICVVLCSKGYPDKFKKRVKIKNLNLIKQKNSNEIIFHASTVNKKGEVYSDGGRVLSFVSISKSLYKSRDRILKLLKKLNWKNGFYRKDIGYKALN